MSCFKVNTHRFDPYKNFRFLVYFGESTEPVCGVSRVGMLKKTTAVVEHREGGDPTTSRKSIGRTSYEPITLERGVTLDPTFETWANLVNKSKNEDLGEDESESRLAGFRKTIRIELLNETGQPVKGYKVYRCWVSDYQALPELDAGADAISIESITIQHEGWARDPLVTEVAEPGAKPEGS